MGSSIFFLPLVEVSCLQLVSRQVNSQTQHRREELDKGEGKGKGRNIR